MDFEWDENKNIRIISTRLANKNERDIYFNRKK